ncbi:DinB family protein [Ferruginibacter sp. SUN106]|uniref:DinB family protein n=1 Tax=Ferruginibacter sp. SUN106 TaxID=2978348 RepID=UPI003D36C738
MKKIIFSPVYILLVFAFGICSSVKAQQLTSLDIKAQMVKDWERAKSYTVDYLNTMPADKYSFKAVDSIRSFAQQMLHLATGNVFLMTSATGIPPLSWASQGLENSKTAQGKDSVMYYVTASYDYCLNAVKTLDVNKWGEKVKLFNMFEETRFAVMNKVFEHQSHHRGQTTIYIRLNGIKPPQERLF